MPGVVPAPHTGGGGAGTTGANPDAARRWAQRLRAAGGLDVANLRRVLTYLDPVSLCAASCVNVLWNGAGTSDDLWRILAHAHGFSHAYSERQGYRRFACFSYKVCGWVGVSREPPRRVPVVWCRESVGLLASSCPLSLRSHPYPPVRVVAQN